MRVWERNHKGWQEDWQSKTKYINEGSPKKQELVGNKIPEHTKPVGGMLLATRGKYREYRAAKHPKKEYIKEKREINK